MKNDTLFALGVFLVIGACSLFTLAIIDCTLATITIVGLGVGAVVCLATGVYLVNYNVDQYEGNQVQRRIK